ncbi:hypothetical protein [Neorhizobium sp. LjRoot104]|uniref:hypothetical protein n=1 Tax=Neorhizobium sp. LjRoot104 TaxID=3342254 RepID=UPI003ED08566
MAVRKIQHGDVTSVLALMKRHADVEGYGDIFAIDEQALSWLVLDRAPPACNILVSENPDGKIVGFALYFILEFTFRNKSMLYLNDFVGATRRQNWRGRVALRRHYPCATIEDLSRQGYSLVWHPLGTAPQAKDRLEALVP